MAHIVEAQKKSIGVIRKEAATAPFNACFHAQVESSLTKTSAAGKAYREVKLRDGADSLTLRAWSDSQYFEFCEALSPGDCVSVEGEFQIHPQFGFEARRWEIRFLKPEEISALFAGDEDSALALEENFEFLSACCTQIQDPRLHSLAKRFLEIHSERFCRAAAARQFHHARRGGLCAHTAQMMRTAIAVCEVYPNLNRDLLIAGILFHDSGKLWETCPPERGFEIPQDFRGELLGHISIGIEIINRIWLEIEETERANWENLSPSSDQVRMHLLHLVASHHGELQFGSPVQPKTPEALALHHLDNLDAKLEMFAEGYEKSPETAPGILDRIRPLGHSILRPLPTFSPAPSPSSSEL